MRNACEYNSICLLWREKTMCSLKWRLWEILFFQFLSGLQMTLFLFWLTNFHGESSRGVACGCTPIILAFQRQMQEDCHKLKVTLVYIVSVRPIRVTKWGNMERGVGQEGSTFSYHSLFSSTVGHLTHVPLREAFNGRTIHSTVHWFLMVFKQHPCICVMLLMFYP